MRVPGWKLSLRPENAFYQEICDLYYLEDEEGFDQLVNILRTTKLRSPYTNKTDVCLYITAEQAVILRLFLPEYVNEVTD